MRSNAINRERSSRVPVTIHFDTVLFERLVEEGRARGVTTPEVVLAILAEGLDGRAMTFAEPAP